MPKKRSGSNKLHNLEGSRKAGTIEKVNISAHEIQTTFCTSIKGHNWAQNESWNTVLWSKGLVSSRNPGSHGAHFSPACVLHNRASAVTTHGLILACWFNVYRVPVKFLWWQLVGRVVIYKQQQQHNTDIRKLQEGFSTIVQYLAPKNMGIFLILQTFISLCVIHPLHVKSVLCR